MGDRRARLGSGCAVEHLPRRARSSARSPRRTPPTPPARAPGSCCPSTRSPPLPMLAIMFGGQRLARRLTPKATPIRAGMGVAPRAPRAAHLHRPRYRASPPGSSTPCPLTPRRSRRPSAGARAARARPTCRDATPRESPARSPSRRRPTDRRCAQASRLRRSRPTSQGITAWFNDADPPRTLAALRGRVVLIDFWTYSCVNCLRTLPHLTAWDATLPLRRASRSSGCTRPSSRSRSDPGNVARRSGIRRALPGGARPRLRHMERLGQSVLAGRVPDRPRRQRPLYAFGEGHYDETEKRHPRLLGDTGARPRSRTPRRMLTRRYAGELPRLLPPRTLRLDAPVRQDVRSDHGARPPPGGHIGSLGHRDDRRGGRRGRRRLRDRPHVPRPAASSWFSAATASRWPGRSCSTAGRSPPTAPAPTSARTGASSSPTIASTAWPTSARPGPAGSPSASRRAPTPTRSRSASHRSRRRRGGRRRRAARRRA